MKDPLLTICVPTFNRNADLSLLLGRLDDEIGRREDVIVLVSDNASTDGTPRLLEGAQRRLSWLRTHRQPQNLGAAGNLAWLVEHAPPCDYLWCCGDDDLIVPGGLELVLHLLREDQPVWLFLPHLWVDGGKVVGGSPAPGSIERHATGPDLYRAYHHWLTFLTASILRREAFQEAVRTVRTENLYIPLLWFFKAGYSGPCTVAPHHLLHASQAISWADRAHIVQTLHFVGLYDEGLHVGLTEEEFGRSLDGLYRGGWGLDQWRRVPLEQLVKAVARFPQSSGLRTYLWTISRERGIYEALPTLDAAAHAVGADSTARELVAAGEAAFEAGATQEAVQAFASAASAMPTFVTAWNDLGVALHQLGHPAAAEAIDAALFVAPDDVDARLNRAELRLADGAGAAAVSDVRHVLEVQPGNEAAAELLARLEEDGVV